MPDTVSSFPYDYITLRWRRLPGNNPHYIVTLINLMPLMKLTRYYTFNSNIYYLFTVNNIFSYFLREDIWQRYITTLHRSSFSVFWNTKFLFWIMCHPIVRIILNLLVFLLVLLDTDFNDVLCQHSTDGRHIYTTNQCKHFHVLILLKLKLLKCIS